LSVTVHCRTCGKPHEMGYCSPLKYAYCDDTCRLKFERVVTRLMDGVPEELVGAEPGTRLWSEAHKEISRREARGRWQQRDELVRQYLATRPRRREPVARRYFPF
jgi:hypothetical protein